MDTQAFQHWLTQLSGLNATQRATVQRSRREPHAADFLATAFPDIPACPHCQAPATELAAWGFSRMLCTDGAAVYAAFARATWAAFA